MTRAAARKAPAIEPCPSCTCKEPVFPAYNRGRPLGYLECMRDLGGCGKTWTPGEAKPKKSRRAPAPGAESTGRSIQLGSAEGPVQGPAPGAGSATSKPRHVSPFEGNTIELCMGCLRNFERPRDADINLCLRCAGTKIEELEAEFAGSEEVAEEREDERDAAEEERDAAHKILAEVYTWLAGEVIGQSTRFGTKAAQLREDMDGIESAAWDRAANRRRL